GSDQFAINLGGSYRHVFRDDGSKTGGSIEVDGENLGMSPIDSPQVPIEYVIYDKEISPEGTTISLDEQYRKAVHNYAVFPNNGIVIDKEHDSFTIKGEGQADIRIIGHRVGYEETFWQSMEV